MKKLIEYLEKKIEGCNEIGGMEKEKWAFIQCLKEARKQALNLHSVSQQRELLAAFAEHLDKVEGQFTPSWMIDNFLKAANCG